MLETPDAVFAALEDNRNRPHGPHRTVTAEEIVEAAEQFEQPDALVTALNELMSAYNHTGQSRRMPVVFARLLKLHDTSPEAFSEWEVHQLHWYFKWITAALLDVPEVPLTALHGWVDQMRERYDLAGHGLQPVAAMRYRIAAHTGTGLADAYDLWVTRPREDLSDCEACELRHRAAFHRESGDDARALEVWRPVLDGTVTCAEEPYLSYAHALAPLLREGRLDEARSHHLAGYRFARGKTGLAAEIGLHLEFCALSRNTARGLEILAESRAMFGAEGSPYLLLGFLTGAQTLLARLAAEGHADLDAAGPAGRTWTVATLLEWVTAKADVLAAAFDARNGTTAVGDRRRARLAAAPLLAEPLPLGLRAVIPPPRREPEPAPRAPEDFAALVTRARDLTAQGHPAAATLWRAIGGLADVDGYVHDDRLGPQERLRAELAEQRGFLALEAGDTAEGRELMLEAAALFERAGLPWPALKARARAACRPAGAAAPEPVAADQAQLDELVARAGELLAGPPDPEAADGYLTVLQCQLFTAYTDVARQLPAPAAAGLDRLGALAAALDSEATRLGLPQHAAAAHQYTADIAARTGRLDEAAAALRTVLDLLEACGRPWRGIRTKALLAQVLLGRGEHEAAVDLLHQVIADTARYDDSSFPVGGAYAMLGRALAQTGDPAGAVRCLSEAAARCDRAADAEGAARLRLDLAGVLSGNGQVADAVAVLESAVVDAARQGDERLLAQLRLNLARGLRELEEYRASAEEFLLLAAEVADWPDQATHALVAAETATALARVGRWDDARTARRAALDAHRAEPNPGPVAEMLRTLARLTMTEQGPGGIEQALGHLAEADDLVAAVPPERRGFPAHFHRGRTHYERGCALAVAERFPEALEELERAADCHEQAGPGAAEARAETLRVAAIVEADALDRVPAALARLDAAITDCRTQGLTEAAQVLRTLRTRLSQRP